MFNEICLFVILICLLPVSNIALAALVGSAVIPDKMCRWAASDFFILVYWFGFLLLWTFGNR